MASITANGAKGHHKFTLTVTETGTSTTNNTSTVSFTFKLSPIQTSWDWSGWSSIKYSIKINGTEYTGTIPSYDGSSTVTLKSGIQTVSHNTDGTKTISYSFSVTDGAGKSYTPGNASASGTLKLTDIPRQAKITSAPNFSDGDNPTITYSNPLGNSATLLQACISLTGAKDDIPYRDIPKTGTSYTFNLTEEERNVLRTAVQSGNSLSVRFYVRTTIGNTNYHSFLAKTFSINNANPIVTASVVDTNEQTILLTGDETKLVKYYSNAKATMSVEAQKGAAIDENLLIIRNGNKTGYGYSHTFNNVEVNEFVFSAEDNRGNVGTDEVNLEMIDYIPITCYMTSNRPDALGNMTVFCYGDYFNGSFGAEENTLSVMCRYAETGGTFSNWIVMNITQNTDSYYASAEFTIENFSQNKYYTFEACAIDKLNTVYSTDAGVKSIPIFHWGEDDFVFEVPVKFRGGVIGFEQPDVWNGTWTPYLNSDAISSYTTRFGTYSKVGNVVTVGFFIKATCYSGYNTNTNIVIYGLPYTPLLPTAGGGMLSGAYVAAGFNFQCYVAETSGNITTRIQACNNTSATNLSTSAGSCNFREGGGEITLSGTITYYTD
jgi:hypothetical protein